jgi:hypothetical protein
MWARFQQVRIICALVAKSHVLGNGSGPSGADAGAGSREGGIAPPLPLAPRLLWRVGFSDTDGRVLLRVASTLRIINEVSCNSIFLGQFAGKGDPRMQHVT